MKIEHPKEQIKIDGQLFDAVAPVVISASRATDLPAFYSKWFMNRLRAGYTVWRNPFNRNQKSYISFQNCRVIVFWSKNPAPMMNYLEELDSLGINYYFQFTLNDYESEKLEPGVPPLSDRIDTFIKLSDRLGKDRVIWRFDPIVMLPSLTPRDILIKIWEISKKIKGRTSKLVFSFADICAYSKVLNNMVREGFSSRENIGQIEPNLAQIEEICDGLAKIRDSWANKGWKFDLATCGEKIDLNRFGISHNRCIDASLMKQLFPNDDILNNYLSYGKLSRKKDPIQTDLFSSIELNNQSTMLSEENLKDLGQRKECGCMISKDIGSYNTCPHGCVYCYANTSLKSAKNNFDEISRKNMESDSIKFERI